MKTPLEKLSERVKDIALALPNAEFEYIDAGQDAFEKLNQNLEALTGVSIKGSSFIYKGVPVRRRENYDDTNQVVFMLRETIWV